MSKNPDLGPLKDPKFLRVVWRMLKTPPKPHKPLHASPLKGGDCFLVIGDKMRIARVLAENPEDDSITADLYRNLEDYRAGRVMEHGFTFWR